MDDLLKNVALALASAAPANTPSAQLMRTMRISYETNAGELRHVREGASWLYAAQVLGAAEKIFLTLPTDEVMPQHRTIFDVALRLLRATLPVTRPASPPPFKRVRTMCIHVHPSGWLQPCRCDTLACPSTQAVTPLADVAVPGESGGGLLGGGGGSVAGVEPDGLTRIMDVRTPAPTHNDVGVRAECW